MSQQQTSPPSIQEMGVRIVNNISRVQKYLEILRYEIKDPQKLGPGSEREDWLEATNALSTYLDDLETLLNSQDWTREDE